MLPAQVRLAVGYFIWALTAIILAAVVISWLRVAGVRVPYHNPVIRGIEQAYEAMMRPIRRAIPTTGGGFDFAPMVAIIILAIVRRMIAGL